jgi:hypothetical protein
MQQILEYPKQILQTVQQLKFSTILKNTTRKKCMGEEAEGEKRCAIGVIMEEYYGFNYDKYIDRDFGLSPAHMDDTEYDLSREILENMLEKHGVYGWQISDRNDEYRWSFKHIANWLESKGL